MRNRVIYKLIPGIIRDFFKEWPLKEIGKDKIGRCVIKFCTGCLHRRSAMRRVGNCIQNSFFQNDV